MNFDKRKTSKSWFQVDYDRELWVPLPVTFEQTKWGGPEAWALHYAKMHVRRAFGDEITKKLMKKEVIPRAQNLMVCQSELAGKIPAHKIYLHCPDAVTGPLGVGMGLWEPQGAREQALQYYGYWGYEQGVAGEPFAEWFDTEHLGRGVKAQWHEVDDGTPLWLANYGFRDDEFEADVHVFTSCTDEARFQRILPDLDVLVRSIHCIPSTGR